MKKSLIDVMLKCIQDELMQVKQWDTYDTIPNKARHYHLLQSLVEAMEIWDCGSTGGYGKGQYGYHTLAERALYIIKKYKGSC